MKVEVSYYIPVKKEIEMTPQEFCQFHANGTFHGEKVVPEEAIQDDVYLSEAADQELTDYFFKC